MELTFGEQIKILLQRKNMTIRDLADLYTEKTGITMSRQNLTQRLKRDNFPEQDMRVIASLLGYSVSIQLNPVTQSAFPEFPQPPVQMPLSSPTPEPVVSKTAVPESIAEPVSTSDAELSEELPSGERITFQIPEAFRKNKPQGDINPLTGEEYLTNTVRKHPEIEEYVQVYDRSTHEWNDVREDYFWEFQEKKKQMMGKDYQAPIMI